MGPHGVTSPECYNGPARSSSLRLKARAIALRRGRYQHTSMMGQGPERKDRFLMETWAS